MTGDRICFGIAAAVCTRQEIQFLPYAILFYTDDQKSAEKGLNLSLGHSKKPEPLTSALLSVRPSLPSAPSPCITTRFFLKLEGVGPVDNRPFTD